MKRLQLNPEYQLYEKDGQPFCDSLQIAETFGKRHDHVIRDIETSLSVFQEIGTPKFGESNFTKDAYISLQNKKQPKYLLTKDGFAYITMGFTGKKAAIFKIDYITRFNDMESFIKSLLTAKLEHPTWTEAIMMSHEEPKHYHFSNEANMINRIVLGIDAKSFRQQYGIKDGFSIRPYLTSTQIKSVETLQRIDIGLLESGVEYNERKQILTTSYNKRLLRLAG